jgi:hypothetical protein
VADGAHVADVHVDVHPDSTGFERELRNQLKAMVVEAKTSPNTKDFRRELQEKLRHLGDFKVLVAPNTDGFRTKLEASLRKMTAVPVKVTPDTSKFRTELERELRGLPSVKVDIDTSGAAAAGRRIRTEIEAALRGGVNVDIDADTRNAMSAIGNIRRELRTLSGTSVNIDVDNAAALADIGAVRSALTGLTTAHIRIDVDTGSSLADLTAVRAMVDLLDGRTVNISVDVDTAAAMANLSAVSFAVSFLDGWVASIRIDVDSIAAIASLAAISLAVARFAALSPTATITVNIRPPGVGAQLIALHALISSFGGLNARANVSIGTGSARAGIQALIAAAIAIGPAIVPAAAAAVAAIGAIGPAAFAAAAGIGVLALAFSGVFDAVKALGDAQSKAGKTAGQYAQRQQQIASAQDQVRDAYRGVQEAERNLANAQRDALRAQRDITRAREEAKQALEDLDSAVKNNALSIRQARLDLADAEKELAKVSNLPVDDRRRVDAQLQYDQAAQALDDLTTRQGRLAKEQEKATKAGVEGSEQVQAAQEKAADAQERVRDAAVAVQRASEQVTAAQRNLQTTIQTTSATGGSAVDTLREKMEALSPVGQKFARFLFSLKDEFKSLKAAAEAGLLPGVQAGIEALLPVLPQITLFVSRVAVAMGNLFKAAGQALASPFWVNFFDLMGQVAAPLLEALGGIIGGLARGFASLLLAFAPFSVVFMRGLAGIAQAFADWAAKLSESNGFNAFIDYVKAEGPKVAKLLGDFVVAFIKLGIALVPLATLVLDGLVALFDWMANADPGTLVTIAAALGAITLAVAGLGGPITLVVAALVAIAAAGAYAYAKFEPFRNAVDKFWTGLKTVGLVVFDAAKTAISTFIDAFKRGGEDVQNTGFLGAIERVGQQARRIFDGIKEGVENFVEGFKRGGTEIQQGGFVAYMQNLGMVARQVFEWMRDTGIPAVAAFLDWIGPKAVAYVKATWQVFEFLFAVFNRVFAGITTVIGFAWNYVVKPVFEALSWYIETIVGPAFTRLWRNVIEPAWTGIKFIIDIAWASIQVVFGLIQIGIKILAGWWGWLYDVGVKPRLELLLAGVKWVWDQIRPLFEAFGDFIGQHVAPKFAAAVDGLKKIWGGLSDGFRVVVRFVVEDLINNGILAAYNWLADKFNVNPKNVRVNVPGLTAAPPNPSGGGGGGAPKFYARGGPVWGAGTATSDSIPAMLSNGEYVIPAHIVKSMGVSFFDWLIGRQKRMPGGVSGNHGPGFALGGLVDFVKDAWNTATDPIGALKDKAMELVGGIPKFGLVKDLMAGVARHTIGGIIEYAKEKFSSLFFGPDRGGTGNFSTGKFDRTPGGWPARQYHVLSPNTAAALAMLLKTWGPPAFSDHFRVGPFDHPWGKAIDFMANSFSGPGLQRGNEAASWMINHPGVFGTKYVIWRRQVTSGDGWHPYSGDSPHTDHVHFSYFKRGGPVGGIPYLHRDRGGFIPPGLSLVNNQTGRDEWAFNDSQMRELIGTRTGGDGDRPLVNVEQMHVTETYPEDIAKALFWEMKTR